MGAPVPFMGFEPPDDPGRLPVDVTQGGSGSGMGGLRPNPISGISIAFGSAHNADAPLWQDLLKIGR